MRWRLTCISDTHAGSLVGLAPSGGIPHPDGPTISTSPTSAWLWQHFEQMLEAESEAAELADRHALLFVGDLMDGLMHHGNIELYHPDPSVEKWIATQIVTTAIEALQPTDVFFISGTPSHVGKNASSEEGLAAAMAAKYPGLVRPASESRQTWGILRLDIDGTLVDVRHHGKLGQLPHTRESYQKRYAFDVWSSQAMYKNGEPAELAIRAHRHKYADSGPVPPHRNATRLISLPCWQLSTEWARSMAFEESPDVGMVGIELRDGRIADVFPQIVYPSLEANVWKP